MCQEIKIVVDERTGDIVGIEANGIVKANTDEFLKLLKQMVGEAAKAETKTEYHAVHQGVKPQIKIKAG